MHSGPDHAVTWHCHPQTQVPMSLPYQKMKALFVSGDEAKKALEGEGHRVQNRTKFQPFHSNDQYEALRHFRQQQRDGDGRTVMAKTMEHAFVYDFVRTATPEAKGNTMMHSNLSAVKKRSEQNRINHGRKRPLTDDDILKMSEIMVPSGMMHKLSEWLKTASVEEKEEYRRVLGSIQTLPRRFHDAPISKARPGTSSGFASRPGTGTGRPGTAQLTHIVGAGGHHHPVDPARSRVVQQVVSDVKAKIRRKVEDRTTTRQEILNSFRFFDSDKRGLLSHDVIKEVLSGVNVDVNHHHLAVLAEHLGSDEEAGVIDYMQLANLVVPLRPGERPGSAVERHQFQNVQKFTGADTNAWEKFDSDMIIKLLRVKLDGRIQGQSNALRNAFRHFDKDGSGKIDAGELQEVLDTFGLFVPIEQCGMLINKFDPDGSGCIDFVEFVHTLLEPDYDEAVRGGLLFGPGKRPSDGPSRLVRLPAGHKASKFYIPSRTKIHPGIGSDAATVVEGLRKQLVDHIWQRFPNMRVAFKSMVVKSRTGGEGTGKDDCKVSLFAFAKALKDWHIDSSPAAARALFDRLDVDKDGFLDYNDFVASLGPLTKELTNKDAAAAAAKAASSVGPNDHSLPRQVGLASSRPPSVDVGMGSLRARQGASEGRPRTSEARPKTADLFLMKPK